MFIQQFPEDWRPCNRYGDFGILRLKVRGQVDETLAYCPCDWGKKCKAQIWSLPFVSRTLEGAFEVERCPLKWFLPDNAPNSVPRGRLVPSLGPAIKRWRERVAKAEVFWEEHAAVFDLEQERLKRRTSDDDGGKEGA